MASISQTRVASPLRASVHAAFYSPGTREFQAMAMATVVLIIASVASLILESMALGPDVAAMLALAETVIVIAFAAEYFLHLWVAPSPWGYARSFWGIVDLLAILPALLVFFPGAGFGIVRTLRVLRVLRMLKLMKLAAEQARISARRASNQQNSVASDLNIYAMALATVLVISSTLAYYAESEQEGTTFGSIPASMWWSIVTITTTGYGDMVPATISGKFVAAATMFAGLALFGILTSVIGRAVMTTLFGRPAEEVSSTGDTDGSMRSGIARPAPPPVPLTEVAVSALAVVAVVLMVLESVPDIGSAYASELAVAELVLVTLFTLDYARNLARATSRLAYATSFGGVVDILSILPTLLSLLDVTGFTALRALRVLRVLRVLKLLKLAFAHRSERVAKGGSTNTFALDLQIYAIAVLCAITVSGTLGYYAEKDVPESAFTSIPAGMWWGVVTLTTTGYGDMVTQNEDKLVQPVTGFGRVVAGSTMLVGLALFGVLTSVIGRALLSSLFGSPGGDSEPTLVATAERSGS